MTGADNQFGYTRAETTMTSHEIESLGGVVIEAGSVVFPRVGAAVLTEKKRLLEVAAAVDENHLVLTPKEGTNSEYLLGVLEWLLLADFVQPGAVPSLNMVLVRSISVPWDFDSQEVIGAVGQPDRARPAEPSAKLPEAAPTFGDSGR